MKKSLFLILTILLFSIQTHAQCSVFASGFGNNSSTPSYNVSGDVQVVLNTDNTITLNLMSNFSTASGPDVRAYLVNPETRTTAMLEAINASTFPALPKIMFGIVSDSDGNPVISPNGMKTFTVAIPAGITISDYTKVFLYCQRFNAFWDFGSFTPFTSNNCDVLGTETVEESNFKLYPNPVNNLLNIDLNSTSDVLEATIYDTFGAVISPKKTITESNKQLDVSLLSSGIYFIELQNGDNDRVVKRFVKQ